MAINLELYKIFHYVVKCGSISSAAKELYISQPAISQSIKLLESQLGGKLFFRNPKGMEMTSEGRAIFEYVERALGLIGEAESRFDQLKSLVAGRIRIGASENICRNYLMPYIRTFRSLYPDVKIVITTGASADIIRYLRTGKVDIGFVNTPTAEEDIIVTPCFSLQDCFVAGSEYKHLRNVKLSLESLLNYPLILLESGTNSRRFIDEYFRSASLVCQPDIEVGSHELLVQFALHNMGISCVTEQFVSNELAAEKLFKLDIEGTLRGRSIGYCSLANFSPTFASKRFIELITSQSGIKEI